MLQNFCTKLYVNGTIAGGGNSIGGLCGYNNTGTFRACYAKGEVMGGGNQIGGLCGYNYRGTFSACYATAVVTIGSNFNGGLCGINRDGSFQACFWDMESSGQPGSSSGKGLTTEEMKTISFYQNAGWTDNGWVIDDGRDYPRLSWENSGGQPIPATVIPFLGSGTEDDPYRISTAQEFASLSEYADVLSKHIKLTADLNMNGFKLYPIGVLGRFTGLFDGNRHKISNAVIEQPYSDHVGLFGQIAGGQIKDVGIENVTTIGRSWVGGLYGNAGYGSILKGCYVTGSVNGFSTIGGLCGSNGLTGLVSRCYTAVTAKSGGIFAGGLCGVNYGMIDACYAAGPVTGEFFIGGFVGSNVSGVISNCYATGLISGTGSNISGFCGQNSGTIVDSFWDMETSGQLASNDGMGRTTAQMQTLSTFTDAGWDFTNESVNGTADIWRLCTDGMDYPKFNWQSALGDLTCPDGVASEDLLYFSEEWISAGCNINNNWCGGRDFNADGAVNLADFVVLAEHWLNDESDAEPNLIWIYRV